MKRKNAATMKRDVVHIRVSIAPSDKASEGLSDETGRLYRVRTDETGRRIGDNERWHMHEVIDILLQGALKFRDISEVRVG